MSHLTLNNIIKQSNRFHYRCRVYRNAIYTARNIISDYVSKSSLVNVCAIDLYKAFDKVNHNALYIK